MMKKRINLFTCLAISMCIFVNVKLYNSNLKNVCVNRQKAPGVQRIQREPSTNKEGVQCNEFNGLLFLFYEIIYCYFDVAVF